jgi:hypothetical protein
LTDPWSGYEAWNGAIEACFFKGQHANEPVYLDMEGERLAAIAAIAAVETDDPAAVLVETVKATLTLPPNEGSIFGAHVRRARAWIASGRTSTPPFLALLAFFSLVAEQMRTDSKFRASNYYGRLCSMLGLPGRDGPVKTKIVRSYMEQATLLWRLYNEWIEEDVATRGKPTAFAFDYRVHVGVPISQAVVRERDRRKFREFFLTYRLQPGQVIARTDMARLLKDWLPGAPLSSGLKTLMRQEEALERVADVACLELQAWDGAIDEQAALPGGPRAASIVLVARLHRHPRPSLEFEALVRAVAPLPPGAYALADGSSAHALAALEALGAEVELLPPHIEGWQAFRDDDHLSIPDLLFAHLRLTRGEVEILREPRRLIVLEYDEGTWSFVEVPRSHLGRDLLLLCVDDLASQLVELLERSARPGYREHRAAALPGLPAGWSAFSDVELMRIPDTSSLDLAALVPVAWTEVALGGGFRLPGRASWLRGHLPEVRVSSPPDMSELEVVLVPEAGEADAEPLRLGVFTGSEVLTLAGQEVPEGDYRVAITERAGARRVLASATLRVRSAAVPRALRGDERTWVAHRLGPSEGWAMVSAAAEPERPASAAIIGAWVGSVDGDAPSPTPAPPLELGETIEWHSEESEVDSDPAEARAGEAPACLRTGAHYIVLPPAGPERPNWNAKIEGTCRYCGLEKWFPARPRGRAGRRGRGRQPARPGAPVRRPQIERLHITPVAVEAAFGFGELMDALAFARRGPWSWLEGIASQVSDEPWFAAEAAQLLSALGHLELVLDRQTLRPLEWAMPPATLATTFADGTAVLCGWRSPTLLERLGDDVLQLRGQVAVEPGNGQPPVVRISGLAQDELALVSATVSDDEHDVSMSEEPARKLAARLTPLSAILQQLPTFVPPVAQPLEQWDPRTNRWTIVDDAREPGAYRTRSLPRRHGFRSEQATGQALARGDARLVKWLAAREQGVGMLAYDEARRALTCRIGAGLPGLYERAAALCSGQPPTTANETIDYKDIPPTIAGAIWEALTT